MTSASSDVTADAAALAAVEAELNTRWPETKLEPSTARIEALLDLLGSPHRAFPVVQVTGTGLAGTCQQLVSQPWWGDARTAAAASDLGREAVAIALDLAPGHALA